MQREYFDIIQNLKHYAKTRMGYPYIGPLKGYFTEDKWIRDDVYGRPLVDNSDLGIVPGSVADVYMNNSGSPYSKSTVIQRDVKEIELEIISIVTRFLGYKKNSLKGYVTAGATEASLSCLWWLREELSEYEKEEVFLITSDQCHYSIKKISNILRLSTVFVMSNMDGSICIISLQKEILKILNKKPHAKIIFSINIGSTVLGAIDNLPKIASIINSLKLKQYFDFRIHTDAAILGPAIPILKIFDNKSVFDYTDTFIFSGHKMVGTTLISGIALTKEKIWKNSFKKHDLQVEYIPGIEDRTVSGSRSGYPIVELYNALCCLNIDTDASNLKKIINTCLINAKYLVENLMKLLPSEEIFYNKNQFNVVFKSPGINKNTLKFLKKFGLMQIGKNKIGICVLAHVDKKLIDNFINEYKTYI